ncbi:MAG: hypothetical protein AB7I18_11590 [Candidatus Berkiella sp.]
MSIIDTLIQAGLANKLFTHDDLRQLLEGTDASRYALVNKALNKGQIVQLKRGVYVMSNKLLRQPLSQFFIASQMIPHSYVSFENALSFHGWIPEGVKMVSSVIHQGRSKAFETPLGEFQYIVIPINQYEFLTGVSRVTLEDQPFLMASPLRALTDLVYEKKLKWQSLDYLVNAMRIDLDNLLTLKQEDFSTIKPVYRSKRVLAFIHQLEDSIIHYGSFDHSTKTKRS